MAVYDVSSRPLACHVSIPVAGLWFQAGIACPLGRGWKRIYPTTLNFLLVLDVLVMLIWCSAWHGSYRRSIAFEWSRGGICLLQYPVSGYAAFSFMISPCMWYAKTISLNKRVQSFSHDLTRVSGNQTRYSIMQVLLNILTSLPQVHLQDFIFFFCHEPITVVDMCTIVTAKVWRNYNC